MDIPQPHVPDISEIHVVCLDGNIEALQSLDVTNNLDTRTDDGESPLMLAALFGHVHIVKYLLDEGAHVEAKDPSGRKAINFASISNPFASMRRVFYGKHGFKFDKSEKTNQYLGAIAELLGVPGSHRSKSNAEEGYRTTSKRIEVWRRLVSIKTPGRDPRKKTVGYIHTAADSTPRMFALSGYSRKRTSRPTLLNGHEWTKVAHLIVGPAIGHDFPPFVFDQGWEDGEIDPRKSGRFFASHSEVLLGTWYVLNLVAALKEKVVTGNNKKRLSKYLKDLAQEDLGEAGKAIISVDQRPCESCGLFLEALTRVTRVKFDVVPRRRLMLMPEMEKKRPFPMYEKNNRENEDDDSDSDMSDPQWGSDTECNTMERELSEVDMWEPISQDDADDGFEEFLTNMPPVVPVTGSGTPEEQRRGRNDQELSTVDERHSMFEDDEVTLPDDEADPRIGNADSLLQGAPELISIAVTREERSDDAPVPQSAGPVITRRSRHSEVISSAAAREDRFDNAPRPQSTGPLTAKSSEHNEVISCTAAQEDRFDDAPIPQSAGPLTVRRSKHNEAVSIATSREDRFGNARVSRPAGPLIAKGSRYNEGERRRILAMTLRKLHYDSSSSSGNDADDEDEDEDFNYAQDKSDPSYRGRRSHSRVDSEVGSPLIGHDSNTGHNSPIASSPSVPTSTAANLPSSPIGSSVTEPSSPVDQIIVISSDSERPHKRRRLFGANKLGDGLGDNGHGPRFSLSHFLFKDATSLESAQ